MARKRNFARHNVTIVNRAGGIEVAAEYFRVKGLVQPPPEFYALEVTPTVLAAQDKLELYVKVDTIQFTDEPRQWFFMWEGRVYVIYATRDFSHYGNDSYQKYIGIYDSREKPDYPFVEPDWDELYGKDGFIPAVDAVEVIVEMKLSKVLDKRIK